MKCEQYDLDLALHAEGDLRLHEAARLERHLQACVRCRELLRALRDSQRTLKAIATEPLEEAALATVRQRVLAGLGNPASTPRTLPAWGWALAASLAVLAVGLAFVWRTKPTAPGPPSGLAAASAAAKPRPAVSTPALATVATRTPHSPEGAEAQPPVRPSTARPIRGVSRGMELEAAQPAPTLSPEDADQLARALVAVSRIRRLSDWRAGAPAAPSSPTVVRLETLDPDVVIYWQLDANGG